MSFRPYTEQELEEFHAKALATAMLLGEPQPVRCSCCRGRRVVRTLFGYRACGQCLATGYDLMCSGTAEALGLLDQMNQGNYYGHGRKKQ